MKTGRRGDQYLQSRNASGGQGLVAGALLALCITSCSGPARLPELSFEGRHHCIAAAPGNTMVAVGLLDDTVLVWRADTGAPTWRLGEPREIRHDGNKIWGVYAVCFSADARFLAAGSWLLPEAWVKYRRTTQRQAIRIWSMETGELALALQDDAGVDRLCFSPDGNYLASGHTNGAVRIWSIEQGRMVHLCVRHDESKRYIGGLPRVTGLAFSPDGRLLASAGKDGRVVLWDVDRATLVAYLSSTEAEPILNVAFSPDGSRLAALTMPGRLVLWSTETRRKVHESLAVLPTIVDDFSHVPRSVLAFSDDGRRVVAWQTAVLESPEPSYFIAPPEEDFSFPLGHDAFVVIWDLDSSFGFSFRRFRRGVPWEQVQRCVARTNDNTLVLWEVGALVDALMDEQFIISAGPSRGVIRAFDAFTGQLLSTTSGEIGAATYFRAPPPRGIGTETWER